MCRAAGWGERHGEDSGAERSRAGETRWSAEPPGGNAREMMRGRAGEGQGPTRRMLDRDGTRHPEALARSRIGSLPRILAKVEAGKCGERMLGRKRKCGGTLVPDADDAPGRDGPGQMAANRRHYSRARLAAGAPPELEWPHAHLAPVGGGIGAGPGEHARRPSEKPPAGDIGVSESVAGHGEDEGDDRRGGPSSPPHFRVKLTILTVSRHCVLGINRQPRDLEGGITGVPT